MVRNEGKNSTANIKTEKPETTRHKEIVTGYLTNQGFCQDILKSIIRVYIEE